MFNLISELPKNWVTTSLGGPYWSGDWEKTPLYAATRTIAPPPQHPIRRLFGMPYEGATKDALRAPLEMSLSLSRSMFLHVTPKDEKTCNATTGHTEREEIGKNTTSAATPPTT
jgi:hypothetical protein